MTNNHTHGPGNPYRQTDDQGGFASRFTQAFADARISDYQQQLESTTRELANTTNENDRFRLQHRLAAIQRQIAVLHPPSEGAPTE